MSADKAAEDPRIARIGARVKWLRIRAGFTSYETFALTHDFDRKQYWRMEKGHNLTLQTLLRLVDIHGITLGEFFGDLGT